MVLLLKKKVALGNKHQKVRNSKKTSEKLRFSIRKSGNCYKAKDTQVILETTVPLTPSQYSVR